MKNISNFSYRKLPSKYGSLRTRNMTYFALPAISGILIGLLIIYIGGLPHKWILVLGILCFLPVLVITIGSLERTIQFLLIFSLSMKMDVYVGFLDRYIDIKPGIPINITTIFIIILFTISGASLYQQGK